jgi:Zn finger protein HypA/HybF involved in hydrogenase expression
MQTLPQLAFIFEHLLRRQKNIISVRLTVGELIPATGEQLQAQWSDLVNGTALSRSVLLIRRVPAEQQCMACFEKYHPLNQETSCPKCGSVGAKIIAGEEFHLDSLKEENE